MCIPFLILCNGCVLSRILCSGFAYVPVSATGITSTRIKNILSTVDRFNKSSSTCGSAVNIVVTQRSLLHSPSSSSTVVGKEITSELLQEFADILVVLDDHTSFVNQTIFQTTLTHNTTTDTSCSRRVSTGKDIAYMMFTSGIYSSLTVNNDSTCCYNVLCREHWRTKKCASEPSQYC